MNPVNNFQAFIHAKCPRCHTGRIFTGNAYSFRLQKTNEYCPVCDLKFEREPGFFYVSMFVSYAMIVAEVIGIGVVSYILGLDLTYDNLWYYATVIFIGVFILSPLNYRYSRVILLHYLTPGLHFDPKYKSILNK